MYNIDLICVGRLKDILLKQAQSKLMSKILKQYHINIIEVEDEKNDKINRRAEIEKIKNIEAERILSKIKKNNFIITFEIDANPIKNLDLKELIKNEDRQNISIIIGGSVGLSQKISDISHKKLSISKMTFPHQLMRIVILEQFTNIKN